MTTDVSCIGERLKVLRESMGLTQNHVAEYLGVDQSLISKYESGERAIGSDVLDALSTLFCCPLDSIIGTQKGVTPIEFAFRTNRLDKEDLLALAIVHKIVLNQMQMDTLSKR